MTTTGALITAMGSVLVVVVGTLLGYFIKRTSTASKMNQENMRDQQWVMRLFSVVRDDYWAAVDYAHSIRSLYVGARGRLITLGDTSFPEPGKVPVPLHRALEEAHAREEASEAEDGK